MGWLLPVGVPGGTVSGFTGVPDGSGLVRHGPELLHLDTDRYRMWCAAEVAPQRQALLEWAEREEIEHPESIVRMLQDSWLLIEERAEPRIQAARLAVCLTGQGAGNGSKESPAFGLIGRGGAVVAVGLALYEVLLRSDGVRPIQGFCEQVDAMTPEGSEATEAQLFQALPLLVRTGIVRLDLGAR